MGVSASTLLYFAVETPRAALLAPSGQMQRVCSHYPSTHAISEAAKFCDQCGAKAALQTIEVPTAGFTAFAAKLKANPDIDFLESLRDRGYEWPKSPLRIGWHKVQAIDNSDVREGAEGVITAIGFRLGEASANTYERPEVLAYGLDDLSRLVTPLLEACEILQIQGRPRLYAKLYYG